MIPTRYISETFFFRIAIVGLINQYLKMKNSSLSLNFLFILKKQVEVIREICIENASGFK